MVRVFVHQSEDAIGGMPLPRKNSSPRSAPLMRKVSQLTSRRSEVTRRLGVRGHIRSDHGAELHAALIGLGAGQLRNGSSQ